MVSWSVRLYKDIRYNIIHVSDKGLIEHNVDATSAAVIGQFRKELLILRVLETRIARPKREKKNLCFLKDQELNEWNI